MTDLGEARGRLTPRDPIQGARPSSIGKTTQNTLSNTLQKWRKVKNYFAPGRAPTKNANRNVKRKTLATVAEEAEHQNRFKDLSSIIKKLAEKYATRKMPLTKDRRRVASSNSNTYYL
ncbi:hypothetical protein DPMN_079337 [Dreissena polymorpha]|uniref:Uncharacterized protein n=1 Tax=Dreissena polymorpha TaxID=45954 RepID=A0A9D4BR58_DREPO|nr:hypothetical protein DPMN_079337 [Dreissena polymorpha]